MVRVIDLGEFLFGMHVENLLSSSSHSIAVQPLTHQITARPLYLPKLKISTPFSIINRRAKSTIISSPITFKTVSTELPS